MDDAPPPAASKTRFYKKSEIAAAILLSIAALLSSYAGFQSDLWDGEQAANYALAEQARTSASKDEMVAGQRAGIDAMMFANWLAAYTSGNRELEQFYRKRFRPEFRTEFNEWLNSRPLTNPRAVPTPFHLPSYVERSKRDAKKLAHNADRLFAAGQRANKTSDTYGQAVVIFALSLFLGGITQTFDGRRSRAMLLSLAALGTLLGVFRLLGLPAIRLY